MTRRPWIVVPVAVLGPLLLSQVGCVTEQIPVERPRRMRIFDLPSGVLSAGAYHGVTVFLEIDLHPSPEDPGKLQSSDFPEVARWTDEERDHESAFHRQLPPLTPEILPDGREILRLRDIHRIEFHHSMFEVGGYRYLPMPRARLYVFKQREGNFSFRFRGQEIVVPADRPWTPSIYYYPEDVPLEGNRSLVRDVLEVGLAKIETEPRDGHWVVNGKRFYPDGSRPLELYEALHSLGNR